MMKSTAKSENSAIDPVCGMAVDPNRTELTAEYQDTRFYFCAPGCLAAFQKDPEKYRDPKPIPKKGWWGRYLCRLNKATDGKAMKCH